MFRRCVPHPLLLPSEFGTTRQSRPHSGLGLNHFEWECLSTHFVCSLSTRQGLCPNTSVLDTPPLGHSRWRWCVQHASFSVSNTYLLCPTHMICVLQMLSDMHRQNDTRTELSNDSLSNTPRVSSTSSFRGTFLIRNDPPPRNTILHSTRYCLLPET